MGYDEITDKEEARKWLHKRGWSLVLAEEELAKWESHSHDAEEEIEDEDIIEEWDDDEDEEDEDWDDEEDEDDDWDEDEDDDDEEDDEHVK